MNNKRLQRFVSDSSQGSSYWEGDQRGMHLLSVSSTRRTVLIIGARKADSIGLSWTDEVVESVAAQDALLISGDALGIEARAHLAMSQRDGSSLAVLSCGLHHLNAHHDLLRDHNVGLLSPFVAHQSARRWTFPRRNARLAHLAQVVILIQAGESSGALAMARVALKLGRSVWALPHLPNHPLHRGCLTLIAEGARPLVTPDAWVNALQVSPRVASDLIVNEGVFSDHSDPQESEVMKELPHHHSALWRASTHVPRSLAELALEANLNYSEALTEATLLELEGWLTPLLGGLYTRAYGN